MDRCSGFSEKERNGKYRRTAGSVFSGAGQRHLRWNESGGSKSTGAVCAFPELRRSFFNRSVLSDAASFIKKQESTEVGRGRSYIFYGDQFNQQQNSPVHSAPVMNDFTCYRNVPCHQVCFMMRSCLRSGAMTRITGYGRIMSIFCTVFMIKMHGLCICR